MPRYYFISDVHLGYGPRDADRLRESRLVRVLDTILTEAQRGEAAGLFVVGDLFDSWFEFGSVVPRRHIRTISGLARIAEVIPVEYLMGNHDFGHRNYFEKEFSIPVHGGDIERTLLGKRFFISHGDGKAANDRGYLILRSILRNPFLQSCYRFIHPDLGIRFAEWISRRSRAYTDQRDALHKEDGLQQFAKDLLDRGAFDYVVMGHRHEPQLIRFGDGTYVNLGDWIKSYSYGVFDGNGFRIERAPEL